MDEEDLAAGIGHNSKKKISEGEIKTGGVAADRLRNLVERIERLQENKKVISDDIKDIFAEAKGAGFDTKVLRALITLRKAEPDTVEEFEMLLDVYRRALGC
jgi:uncharacterized protein (UPF0335 family)